MKPAFRFTADDLDTLNAVLDWARDWGVGVSFKYHEIDDHWALVTWSPAKRECLETKESSTIAIAFDRLLKQWEGLEGGDEG